MVGARLNKYKVRIANSRSKLTEEDVHAIREDKDGHAAVARKYNVDPKTVKRIRDGELWASLPVRKPPGEPSGNPV